MKFIDNKETFVMAVLACIYEELKLKAREQTRNGNLGLVERMKSTMDSVVRCYKTIFQYKHFPAEYFKASDMLELVENATFLIKLQTKVDDLIKVLGGDQITIEIIGGFPSYKNQVLPNFGNFIIFREVW